MAVVSAPLAKPTHRKIACQVYSEKSTQLQASLDIKESLIIRRQPLVDLRHLEKETSSFELHELVPSKVTATKSYLKELV